MSAKGGRSARARAAQAETKMASFNAQGDATAFANEAMVGGARSGLAAGARIRARRNPNPELMQEIQDQRALTAANVLMDANGTHVYQPPPYNPAIGKLYRDIASDVREDELKGFFLNAYDELDPAQARQLRAIIPSLQQERAETRKEVFDQYEFITRMAETPRLQDDEVSASIMRMINLVGGAEPILNNPSLSYIVGGGAVGAGAVPDNGMTGLFKIARNFNSNMRAADPDDAQRRLRLAEAFLPHFGRFFYGTYDWQGGAQRAAPLGAQNLVAVCEKLCMHDVDPGTVAQRLRLGAFDRRGARAPQRARSAQVNTTV